MGTGHGPEPAIPRDPCALRGGAEWPPRSLVSAGLPPSPGREGLQGGSGGILEGGKPGRAGAGTSQQRKLLWMPLPFWGVCSSLAGCVHSPSFSAGTPVPGSESVCAGRLGRWGTPKLKLSEPADLRGAGGGAVNIRRAGTGQAVRGTGDRDWWWPGRDGVGGEREDAQAAGTGQGLEGPGAKNWAGK